MLISELADKYGRKPEKLTTILLECQKSRPGQYLTEDDLRTLSVELGIPESKVFSAASYYSLLSTSQRGRHIIRLCRDVPCHVRGSFNLREKLERELGVSVGGTTEDGMFSLEYTSCLGYCEQAPAMMVDDDCYGNVGIDTVTEILDRYRRAP